jgi:hypothetical protein
MRSVDFFVGVHAVVEVPGAGLLEREYLSAVLGRRGML